jgi:hypothetical protein
LFWRRSNIARLDWNARQAFLKHQRRVGMLAAGGMPAAIFSEAHDDGRIQALLTAAQIF